ncbi:MAG: DUF4301 family protein [Bacteroidales bacterium]|nr:DUF4301 family protein [Bacteroidales bacterium]
MYTQEDRTLLAHKGMTEQQINAQLECFKKGFRFLELAGAASVEKGILRLNENEEKESLQIWDQYLLKGKTIQKFVPASGAASRMFKNLFEFLEAPYDTPQTSFEKTFFAGIRNFAFFTELNNCCISNVLKDIPTLIEARQYKIIVHLLLSPEGLNYGSLPKGILKFHNYPSGPRTPMEEHLVEGALYARGGDTIHIHFTVSSEHRAEFEKLAALKKEEYEKMFGVSYDITFSEQKPSTDTIAADMDNNPFRDENGTLVFRPGGHGALIENLKDLNADIVFIKNIDNVVPDNFKEATVKYKKVIAGKLVELQEQIFDYIRLLDSGKQTREQMIEIAQFLQRKLYTRNPDLKVLEDSILALYLKEKLNRPIRVCGMVKNTGEPGGGPFLTINTDGTISLQILESSQIDLSDPSKKEMFVNGTHFNPVDLVCSLKDYQGKKFDLSAYVDKNTGFISHKSKNGKELKALELPGLWNGAMSDWNTVFVEVPIETFNPVKTVNDLLREQHQ